jgi:hypothetical protein
MINPVETTLMRVWAERIIYALLIGAVTLSLFIAFTSVWRAYFNRPPITLTSLDPAHLGSLCPGDELSIRNDVRIEDDIIVFYYVSTMDINADFNYPGTQRAYVDLLHPHPAHFEHELLWTVPNLPAGHYSRVFGVRNVGANQDVVFVTATYEISEGCIP